MMMKKKETSFCYLSGMEMDKVAVNCKRTIASRLITRSIKKESI